MKAMNHVMNLREDFHKGSANTGFINGNKKYLSSKSKPKIKTFIRFSSMLNEKSGREETKINNSIIRYRI